MDATGWIKSTVSISPDSVQRFHLYPTRLSSVYVLESFPQRCVPSLATWALLAICSFACPKAGWMRTQWVNGISVEIKQIGGLIWLLWSAFPSSPFRLVSDCLGVSTTYQEINGLKGEVHHLHQRSFRKNSLQVFCPGCNQNVTVSMSGSDRSDHVIGLFWGEIVRKSLSTSIKIYQNPFSYTPPSKQKEI